MNPQEVVHESVKYVITRCYQMVLQLLQNIHM